MPFKSEKGGQWIHTSHMSCQCHVMSCASCLCRLYVAETCAGIESRAAKTTFMSISNTKIRMRYSFKSPWRVWCMVIAPTRNASSYGRENCRFVDENVHLSSLTRLRSNKIHQRHFWSKVTKYECVEVTALSQPSVDIICCVINRIVWQFASNVLQTACAARRR